MVEKNDLKFEVLSDEGNKVARQFGIAFHLVDDLQAAFEALGIKLPEYNGDDAWELPIPGTFVVDTDRTIRLAYVDANYTTRLEPADILESLRQISSNN